MPQMMTLDDKIQYMPQMMTLDDKIQNMSQMTLDDKIQYMSDDDWMTRYNVTDDDSG
jgi:hypothetical protein